MSLVSVGCRRLLVRCCWEVVAVAVAVGWRWGERGRETGVWGGLLPHRRLVTPLEGVRLLPPGGEQSRRGWVERSRRELALVLVRLELRVLVVGVGCVLLAVGVLLVFGVVR